MRYRPHRRFLDESLADAVEVNGLDELVAAMQPGDWYPKDQRPTRETVTVEKYGKGIDERCGWDTHIVCVNGQAWGFTDGPLDPRLHAKTPERGSCLK